MKPFMYVYITEPNRFGLGVEFILEHPKYAVLFTVMWWTFVLGLESK